MDNDNKTTNVNGKWIQAKNDIQARTSNDQSIRLAGENGRVKSKWPDSNRPGRCFGLCQRGFWHQLGWAGVQAISNNFNIQYSIWQIKKTFQWETVFSAIQFNSIFSFFSVKKSQSTENNHFSGRFYCFSGIWLKSKPTYAYAHKSMMFRWESGKIIIQISREKVSSKRNWEPENFP